MEYLQGSIGREWSVKLRDLQKGEFVYQLRNKIELLKTEPYGKDERAKSHWYIVQLSENVVSLDKKVKTNNFRSSELCKSAEKDSRLLT